MKRDVGSTDGSRAVTTDGLVASLLGEPPSLPAAQREFDAARYTRALEHLTVLAGAVEPGLEQGTVLELGAEASLRAGRPFEALAWAEELLSSCGITTTGALVGAAAAFESDRLSDARTWLVDLRESGLRLNDEDRATFHRLWALLHVREGDDAAAWPAIEQALAIRLEDGDSWQIVAIVAGRSQVDLERIAADVPDHLLRAVAGYVALSEPKGADRVLEALWEQWPGDRRILAALTLAGPRLPLERGLEWSARLRTAGLADHCAVLGRAARSDLPATDRVMAAAIAFAAFSDRRGLALLEAAASQVADEVLDEVFHDLAELDRSEVLESFVVAASSTSARALRVASLLAAGGAASAAVSVVAHAASQTDPGSPTWLHATQALPRARRDQLQQVLRSEGADELCATLAL